MTTAQARAIFDQIAATHRANGDRDQAARVELLREYLTNDTFRAALTNQIYALTN